MDKPPIKKLPHCKNYYHDLNRKGKKKKYNEKIERFRKIPILKCVDCDKIFEGYRKPKYKKSKFSLPKKRRNQLKILP